MRPLSILVGANTPADPDSGAAGTVYQTNQALRGLGHHVDEFWSEDLRRRIKHGNLHYLLELPRCYRNEVRRRVRTRDYQVVELNQPHAFLAARESVGRACSGRVFVNRSHGVELHVDLIRQKISPPRRFWRRNASRFLQRLLRRHWDGIMADADGVIVSSSLDREFLETRYPKRRARVAVVSQGVAPAFLTQIPDRSEASVGEKLIHVGQMAPVKAPEILAKAVDLILHANPAATFTWVLDRRQHAAARALFSGRCDRRITLQGWMPQNELRELLDQQDLFLFPSHFEGFGKAPLEAMARGIPVLVTDVGGMRDYVKNDETGIVVPPANAQILAEKALHLLGQPVLRDRLGTAGRQAARRHTWARSALETTAFYAELLTRKKSR